MTTDPATNGDTAAHRADDPVIAERSIHDISDEITGMIRDACCGSHQTTDGIYVSMRAEVIKGRIAVTAEYFDDGFQTYEVVIPPLQATRAAPDPVVAMTVPPVVEGGDDPVIGGDAA